jgi:hypothetical protein
MDKKELKLKAEQRLFEAASRYFEEPDCVEKAQLKEKTLVDPDTGKKYTIDDEILYNATLDKGEDRDEWYSNCEPIDTTAAIDYKFKSEIAKANAAKFAKRAGVVANAESDVFNALLPKIEAATKYIIKQKIDDGTFKPVGTGHWAIPSNAGKAIQNEIYYKIVHPKWKELGGARNPAATELRRAWERWTGEYDKPKKYTTMQGRLYDLTAEVGKSANESTAFDKMLYKAMNEHLTHLYSEKYNVCLTEANKMFIIDDVIAE